MSSGNASNRRDFLLAAAAVLSSHTVTAAAHRHFQEAGSAGSIQDAIDAITAEVPGERVDNTVDTVKHGDASRPLQGIATTFLATCEVIEKAREHGANLLITHEPTFYNHRDEVDWLQDDPVYRHKRQLLADSNIVVWRFHDYWHRVKPDPVTEALIADFGLAETARLEGTTCTIPPISLDDLAGLFKRKLGLRMVRVIGDPTLSCSRIGLLPGAWGGRAQITAWSRDRVDALVCGEINEWETNIYVKDAISAGHRTGLIILGHVNTEEPGMRLLAEWLKPRFPAIPIHHVPMGEPFRFL